MLLLGERATLKPSERSGQLIQKIRTLLLGRLTERVSFEGEFAERSVGERLVPFPPLVTTLHGLVSCYVMQSVVTDSIGDRMGDDLQRFPVQTSEPGTNYEMTHPCGELVAIDEAKASIKRFPSSGRVQDVIRYAFKPEATAGKYLFRASMLPHIQLCTDEFRDDALRNEWTPLVFVPIWDSEHEPFAHTPKREEVATRPEIYGPNGFKSVPERLMPSDWLAP